MKRWFLALLCWGWLGIAEAALISRLTTWTDGQVLTHSALNNEFDEVFDEVNGSLNAANLAATLTFADSDFLDLSAINMSSTTEGLKLGQATSCSSATAEGQLCWDTDGDLLYAGSGSAALGVSLTTNIASFSRTAAAGSGAQTVAHGLGVIPLHVWTYCEDNASSELASWGFADEDGDEANLYRNATNFEADTSNLITISDGTNIMQAVFTSADATNVTVTWTKSASGEDVDCLMLAGR